MHWLNNVNVHTYKKKLHYWKASTHTSYDWSINYANSNINNKTSRLYILGNTIMLFSSNDWFEFAILFIYNKCLWKIGIIIVDFIFSFTSAFICMFYSFSFTWHFGISLVIKNEPYSARLVLIITFWN
jgi:hypothetical protein